jgi:hypothetical protein
VLPVNRLWDRLEHSTLKYQDGWVLLHCNAATFTLNSSNWPYASNAGYLLITEISTVRSIQQEDSQSVSHMLAQPALH